MGGAVGTITPHQISLLPELIDNASFDRATRNLFAKGAFAALADHDGKMTKERLQELILQRDVVFSYEWGIDSKGRSCVRRVQKITDFLASKGLFLSSDDDQDAFVAQSMVGGNRLTTRDRVREKVANVQCMVLFLTVRYFQKLTSPGDEQNNVLKIEFDEFLSKHGARRILPALFEPEAAITPDKPAPYYDLFRHRRVVDISNFEKEPKQLDDLYDYIIHSITPLREGGDYASRTVNFKSSRMGRYYSWIMEKFPPGSLSHDQAMKYAQILVDEQFESVLRLGQIVDRDDGFLERLGFSPEHALLIKLEVRKDTKDNFDVMNAATISAIMAQKESQLASAGGRETERILQQLESAQAQSEGMEMGVEDDRSMTVHTSYLQSMKQQQFEEKRLALYQERQKMHDRLAQQMDAFSAAVQSEREHQEQQAWHQEVVHVLQAATLPELANRFRLIVQSVEENTSGVSSDPLAERPPGEGEGGGEAEENDWEMQILEATASLVVSSKRNRVQSFLQTSSSSPTPSPSFSSPTPGGRSFIRHSLSSASPLSGSPSRTVQKPSRAMLRYGVQTRPLALKSRFLRSRDPCQLVQLLQQAACVLHRLEQLCVQEGVSAVQQALAEGLGKLVLVFLVETYVYPCHFLDISLPAQTLSTLSTLTRCQPDEKSLQESLLFVYFQCGAIENVLALLKYHVEDRIVTAEALRFLDRLLTSSLPTTTQSVTTAYLRDPASVLLLVLAIERFHSESNAIVLASTAIVTKLLRGEVQGDVLRKSRVTFILRAFNQVVQEAAPSGGCHLSAELLLSMVRTVEDLYFRAWRVDLPVACYHFASAVQVDAHSLRTAWITQMDEHTLLPVLMAQMTIHAENRVVLVPVLRALGNMLYLRHDVKHRLMHAHFPREIMRVLRYYQPRLKEGTSAEREEAVEVLSEAFLSLANSVDVCGPLDGQAPLTSVVPSTRRSVSVAVAASPTPSHATARTLSQAVAATRKSLDATSEWERLMIGYLEQGLAELVCDLWDHHQLADSLLHGLLVLLCKMMQNGNTLCTQRFVALGLVDKLTVYLETNPKMPRALFEVTCQLLLCLLSSDDIVVNATRRLADKTRCEWWLVSNMSHSCRAKETGGHWSHFYSHSIRANAARASEQWCRTCVYSCLVATRLCAHIERGPEMIQRFQAAGLPTLLHAVPIDDVNAVAALSTPLPSAPEAQCGQEAVSEDAGACEDDDYLFPVMNSSPSGDGLRDTPLVAHRSVEYMGNVTVRSFDHSVFQLFQWFHIAYGPRTLAQRDYVSMAQQRPGPYNALARDIVDRIIE